MSVVKFLDNLKNTSVKRLIRGRYFGSNSDEHCALGAGLPSLREKVIKHAIAWNRGHPGNFLDTASHFINGYGIGRLVTFSDYAAEFEPLLNGLTVKEAERIQMYNDHGTYDLNDEQRYYAVLGFVHRMYETETTKAPLSR